MRLPFGSTCKAIIGSAFLLIGVKIVFPEIEVGPFFGKPAQFFRYLWSYISPFVLFNIIFPGNGIGRFYQFAILSLILSNFFLEFPFFSLVTKNKYYPGYLTIFIFYGGAAVGYGNFVAVFRN